MINHSFDLLNTAEDFREALKEFFEERAPASNVGLATPKRTKRTTIFATFRTRVLGRECLSTVFLLDLAGQL